MHQTLWGFSAASFSFLASNPFLCLSLSSFLACASASGKFGSSGSTTMCFFSRVQPLNLAFKPLGFNDALDFASLEEHFCLSSFGFSMTCDVVVGTHPLVVGTHPLSFGFTLNSLNSRIRLFVSWTSVVVFVSDVVSGISLSSFWQVLSSESAYDCLCCKTEGDFECVQESFDGTFDEDILISPKLVSSAERSAASIEVDLMLGP
uniref:Secreted protein n=1 Tax=Denticeps clupeoides TaxID=299321 RepID=A0AAY4C8S9_9TELE